MATLRDRAIQRLDHLDHLLIGFDPAEHKEQMPMSLFDLSSYIAIELMQRTFDPLNMQVIHILPPILGSTFGIHYNRPITSSVVLVPA